MVCGPLSSSWVFVYAEAPDTRIEVYACPVGQCPLSLIKITRHYKPVRKKLFEKFLCLHGNSIVKALGKFVQTRIPTIIE